MPKKIKVCFVSPKSYPLFCPDCGGVFGGAEVDVYMLGRALACDDLFDVSIVVADYGQAEEVVVDNVKLIKSLKPGSYSPLAAISIWKALKKTSADIYFIKTISPGIILLNLFCLISRKKYIIRTATTRDCDGSYLKNHKLLAPLLKIAFKKADLVYTQNNSDLASIKEVYGIEAKAVANGHYIPPVNKNCSKDVILWAARSSYVKNPLLFIKLAASFPQRRFVMVCPKAFGNKNYQALANEASKVQNLEFVEGVRYLQMQKFYEKAALFVNTSDSEGFANTFIEAAKAGVPIASYKVNPDNFLNKHNCGRCAEGSFEKLVETVRLLIDDKQLNKELGGNGRKYAQENHDIRKIAEIYKNDFRELLK